MKSYDVHLRSSGPISEHKLRLRPGFTVCFRLPTDLTAQEAIRLSEFMKILPLPLQETLEELSQPEDLLTTPEEPDLLTTPEEPSQQKANS